MEEPRSTKTLRSAVSFLARARSAIELTDDLNRAEVMTIAALDHIHAARAERRREADDVRA